MLNYLNDIVSLDIETTGLSPEDDKIMSLGAYSESKSSEFFFDTRSKRQKRKNQNPMRSLLEKHNEESFVGKQLRKGRFSEIEDAWKDGKLKRQSQVMDAFNEGIRGHRAILIQNSNFENRFISEKMKERDRGTLNSRYRTLNGERMFYTPPGVTSIRSEMRQQRQLGANIEDLSELGQSMLSEYEKEFSKNSKGFFVIDLMDISRAVFSKASASGLLNPKTYDHTLNISDLSRLLLNEEETHQALSDSRQQLNIFKKLISINNEISGTGPVRDETLTFFRRLDSINSTKENRGIVGLYETGMREIKVNGSTRLIDPLTTRMIDIDVEEDNGKIHKAKIQSYKNVATAKTEEELIEFIGYRFGKTQEEVSEILDLERDKVKPAPEKIDNSVIGKVKSTWKGMNALEKGIASGTVGLLAFGLMSSAGTKEGKSNGRDRQLEKKKKVEMLYDSSTFRDIRDKNKGHNRM